METKNIRNICLMGHGNSGKTSLAESMLFTTGALDRQGKVSDGNTVCDYDPEEIKRQISISTSVAPVSFNGCKVNVLDCPAFLTLWETCSAPFAPLRRALSSAPPRTGSPSAWSAPGNISRPRTCPLCSASPSATREHGDYFAALDALKAKYGSIICPVTIPMSDGSGVIDLVHNTAYQTKAGKTAKVPVPAADQDRVEELRMALMETAAGATEELMEKFFDTMELSEAEMPWA